MHEKFILLEFPRTLYAGFKWALLQLQRQATGGDEIAFAHTIANLAQKLPTTACPKYATDEDFTFKLSILRRHEYTLQGAPLLLPSSKTARDSHALKRSIRQVCQETTLDEGQATALCQNLCRNLAFTQGPPGTGKTYDVLPQCKGLDR